MIGRQRELMRIGTQLLEGMRSGPLTLPSLESVLGRIERFLFMPSPCSNDTKEREALVCNALTGKRTLLGRVCLRQV